MQLLSVALLFAQLGMVVHASTHLKADSHASQLCGQCLSYSPLQNMVGGAPPSVLAVSVAHHRPHDGNVVANAPRQPFNAFHPRGPPSLP